MEYIIAFIMLGVGTVFFVALFSSLAVNKYALPHARDSWKICLRYGNQINGQWVLATTKGEIPKKEAERIAENLCNKYKPSMRRPHDLSWFLTFPTLGEIAQSQGKYTFIPHNTDVHVHNSSYNSRS